MCQTSSKERFLKSKIFIFTTRNCYYLNVAIFYPIFLLLILSVSFNPEGNLRQGILVILAADTPTPSTPTPNLTHQSQFTYRKSSLALLSGTLRTYQKASCDDTFMKLTCPEGTTISIQFAQYGKTAATPILCRELSAFETQHPSSSVSNNFTCYSQKAMQSIVTRCQKKIECKFQILPKTFGGDPCPRARKFAEVAYKCRPSQFISVIGCENDVVQLTCNPGSRLAIYSANFGRTEYESVQCPQPSRVPEESCLASYATETVMQKCHGKRRCSIRAEASTFGSPCKPESRKYLKVIHTCVPRKVLKRKYQGELEADETEDADDIQTDDGADSGSNIIEQSSISSSNHPYRSHNSHHSTQESESQVVLNSNDAGEDSVADHFARSSAVLNSDSEVHELDENASHQNQTSNSSEDIRFINLISQSINAYAFIERNSHTFWLLVVISMLSVFLLLLFLLLIRLVYVRRHKGNREQKAAGEERMKSSTIRRASGLSDIDELSLVMDPNEYVHLSTIQRRGNPSSSTFSSGLAKNRVVRYSNSRNSMLGRQESDTSPRSFHQEHESDIHFFFG